MYVQTVIKQHVYSNPDYEEIYDQALPVKSIISQTKFDMNENLETLLSMIKIETDNYEAKVEMIFGDDFPSDPTHEWRVGTKGIVQIVVTLPKKEKMFDLKKIVYTIFVQRMEVGYGLYK